MTDATPAALRTRLLEAVAARVTPGAVVEVGSIDGVTAVEAVGRLTYAGDAAAVTADTVYDLASLTKVIATTTLAMAHAARGTLPLDLPVADRYPALRHDRPATITVADLLAHAAGWPAHRPYYRRVAGRRAIAAAIAAEPWTYAPRTRHEYTDLGFMLLGFLIEDAGGAPLDRQFDAWRKEALPDAALTYGAADGDGGRVAPTEADAWRGRVLVGHVHDANAAALGGVAAHAGLFGTAGAVGAFARWVLRLWLGRVPSSAGIPADIMARFAARGTVPGSSRALGWDTMLPSSSCGPRFAPASIGHTGYTGTSLWIDPVRQRYVVLLTNRVHPTHGPPDAIRALRIAVHELVAREWPA